MPGRISVRAHGRLIWGLTIVGVVAAFVFGENDIAPKFSECVRQIASNQGARSPHENGFILFDLVRAQGICTLSLIDRHNGFFAFLGTAAIAGFTFILWRATNGMLLITQEQRRDLERSVKAAEDAAAAAKLTAETMAESNRITYEYYVADKRPWVSVAVQAVEDLMIAEDGRWTLFLNLRFKNLGNSPALGIIYQVALVKSLDNIIEIQEEMTTYIQSRPDDQKSPMGLSLFPGQEISRFCQAQRWSFIAGNQFGFKARDQGPPDGRFIVGCALYYFASGQRGRTTFSYMVTTTTPSRGIIAGGGGAIEDTDRTIGVEALIFHPMWVGNHAE